VIFDFWGTLAPLAWDRWQRAFGAIAKVLGVPQEQFERPGAPTTIGASYPI